MDVTVLQRLKHKHAVLTGDLKEKRVQDITLDKKTFQYVIFRLCQQGSIDNADDQGAGDQGKKDAQNWEGVQHCIRAGVSSITETISEDRLHGAV